LKRHILDAPLMRVGAFVNVLAGFEREGSEEFFVADERR
jgi:hypothetical protein